MSRALDVANDLSTLGPKYDAGNFDAISVTNSVVDAGQLLGIDLSGLANAGDYISVNVTNAQDDEVLVFSSGTLVNQALSSIDHDALTNYVADEHIDWTNATANFSTSGTLNTHTIPSGTGTLALTSDIPTNNNQLTNGAGYLTAESDTLDSVTGRGNSTTNGISIGTLNTHTIPSGTGTLALTSDIPTNNNQLTNGAGYITSASLSGYLTAESDTLDSVTGRGNSTTNGISVGSLNTHTIPSGTGTLALVGDIPTNNNQLTNGAGYLAAESDTLDSVTGRGNSTSNGISVGALTATSLNTHTIPSGTGTLALEADTILTAIIYSAALG
jgi:hypothetical protein